MPSVGVGRRKRFDGKIPRSFHRAISFEKGTFKGDVPISSVKLEPSITKNPLWKEATEARYKEKKLKQALKKKSTHSKT